MQEQPELSPAIQSESPTAAAFDRLYRIIQILRAPDGCPWDIEQTPLTVRRYLVEETFEAVDAITQQDSSHAKEELGDVLLNTAMLSYMYEQQGSWTIAQAINELCDKLVRRHPHVFSQSEGAVCVEGAASNSQEVLAQWDKIKSDVEGRGEKSVLDEVPSGFPPLLKAAKYQKKAAKKGFDWEGLAPVEAKIAEELEELKAAYSESENSNDETLRLHTEEEAGDLLFAAVNYIRKLGIDPTLALSRANRKFYERFCYVERKMAERGAEMSAAALPQMDTLWNEAKRI